ncbi:MAG: hypothetical protein RLZZ198_79 [Bacteroidota bacterium]|jgi:hypothetical protein
MKLILSFFTLLFSVLITAQTQNVRGKVMDSETSFPLAGAKVEIDLKDANGVNYRAVTDGEGEFKITNVPVGKYGLTTKCAQYEPKTQTIEISSGKELILSISLQELVTNKEEVVVTGRKKGEIINELAVISAQQFSVEETNRYPGSRMDPARMASNFAGVQGADDSRNDIIVRGNSPLGVVWRVEGIDIPNPNHFAIAGSSGGPVSVLNNKILGNSDFLMSAFPAEYGNSVSGVFDLKLRSGNDQRHEFTGQFGFLGTEFLAEGPLNKKGTASFLMMGRYSTLSLFKSLGIQLGTDAIPTYGDLAFKFNFKLRKGGNLSFWGMGGKSNIAIMISEKTEYTTDLYGEGDRDQYFGTSMGVTGLTYKKAINEKTFVSSTLALSQEIQHANHDYLQRSLNTAGGDTSILINAIYPLMAYTFTTNKISSYTAVNHKINKQHLIKFGYNADLFLMNMHDSALIDYNVPDQYFTRWNYEGSCVLIQPFLQWKWRMSDNTDFTAGIHSQYFSMSNSLSPAELRLGFKHKFPGNQSVFAGGGMHSQIQPLYTYVDNRKGVGNFFNKGMDFTRSIHSGVGYEKFFNKGFSIRTEAYYQYLYNIPVTIAPSAFSMINMGSGFTRIFADSLQNTGTGYNYGLELTVQKYFDKSFFFLFSGTLYDSKYTGSDGILRNTSYNGAYVANLLAGKEFNIGKRNVLGIGAKVTTAGGKRYGLVDIAKTNQEKDLIYQDSMFNALQFKDYFRMDLKISWRMNAKAMTHEIGLDLVNILGTENVLSLAYAPSLDPAVISDPSYQPITRKYQLGFLPIFYYKIDFRAGGKQN